VIKELIAMPQMRLDAVDAIELAEVLTFLTDWLSGSQKHVLEESLAAFVGHPAYTTAELWRRPAPIRLPPRRQRRRRTLRRASAMTTKPGWRAEHLTNIIRITPNRYASRCPDL
jgi:hypothetical protein